MNTSAIVDDMIHQLENRDWGSIEVKRYFVSKIDAAIAAAVAEEREQCAVTIDQCEYLSSAERRVFAAAIRARNGAGK